MPLTNRRFVIFDRDGTLIVERHYLSEPVEVELIHGVVSGLRTLINRGFGLIVVTNQSGIGRGFFDEEALDKIHQRLCRLLANEGIYLDGIFFCPHLPSDKCFCRKPETGLLHEAAKLCGFNPENCFVVGDKASDIEMGQRVGATTLLVRTGYGTDVEKDNTCDPDYLADGLVEAANLICGCVEKE